jgi:hypothetical protein
MSENLHETFYSHFSNASVQLRISQHHMIPSNNRLNVDARLTSVASLPTVNADNDASGNNKEVAIS